MAATPLVELTQAALAKLRSPECNMRIVQLQAAGITVGGITPGSDIDMSASIWRHRLESDLPFPVMLPTALLEYYKALQTDGLHFAASVSRSSSIGAGVAATGYVCICRLNRLAEILPVTIPQAEMVLSFDHVAPPRSPAAHSRGAIIAGETPRGASGQVRCFLLSPGATDCNAVNGVDGPRSPICDILLVYRDKAASNNPEVWGRHASTGRCFFLCRTVEDYIRLGCRMFWVAGWQMCFDTEVGPPQWSLPWLRMLAPGPLSQALRVS